MYEGNKLILPSDTATTILGGLLVNQRQGLANVTYIGLKEAITRIVDSCLVRNVREVVAGLKHEVDLLDTSLIPVVLDRVGTSEALDRSLIVLLVISIVTRIVATGSHTPVNIYYAIITGIVGVLTSLGEGQSIVIKTYAILAVRTALPPVGTVGSSLTGLSVDRTAAKVAIGLLVPLPSVSQRLHIGRSIEWITIGVLQGKLTNL